jgi:hypothetical protein
MRQHVIAQVARLVAQRLELGQLAGRAGALLDEIVAHVAERLLQLRVGQRAMRIVLKLRGCGMRRHRVTCPSSGCS